MSRKEGLGSVGIGDENVGCRRAEEVISNAWRNGRPDLRGQVGCVASLAMRKGAAAVSLESQEHSPCRGSGRCVVSVMQQVRGKKYQQEGVK